MSGRFDGLDDQLWTQMLEAFPESERVRRGRGMPRVGLRQALNSVLYVLITGCRWCDIPEGAQWASRSSAHRALKRWAENGTFFAVFQKLLEVARRQVD